MGTKEAKQMDKALFDFYGKPSIGQALPLAIQHVLAMIVGCVTPSIIVAGVAGISQEDSVILIQAALVMSALTTLLQLFPFIKTKNFRIGSALPVMMGISFAYVPIMQSIAQDADVGTILGAQIVGGIVAIIVGIFIKQIRHLFPGSMVHLLNGILRHGIIRIVKENILALSVIQTGISCGADTFILLRVYPKTFIFLGIRSHNLFASVHGAVIHQNDFIIFKSLCFNCIQHPRQCFFPHYIQEQ